MLVRIATEDGSADEVRSGLAQLWHDGALCDIQLLVEGREFAAHRVVLAASSPYMKARLAGNFSDASQATIDLPELKASAFEAVLKFVYTQEVELPEEMLGELLQAACRLQVQGLIEATSAEIAARLTPQTSIDAMEFASRLLLTPLISAAKKVALSSFDEVVATSALKRLSATDFEELLKDDEMHVESEDTVFHALEEWVAAQMPAPAHETEEALLRCVRFAFVRGKDHVEASALVQRHPKILLSAYREVIEKVDTARNRARHGGRLQFEDLKVGMQVKVNDDASFVEEECKKPAPGAEKPVNWNSRVRRVVGKTVTVKKLVPKLLQGVSIDSEDDAAVYLPFTVLKRVAEAAPSGATD